MILKVYFKKGYYLYRQVGLIGKGVQTSETMATGAIDQRATTCQRDLQREERLGHCDWWRLHGEDPFYLLPYF
jgi:hypothetical protein